MHIEYYTLNGHEYARLRDSVRKGGAVVHATTENLGRVLDRDRLVFKSRKRGVFQYLPETGVFAPAPGDLAAPARANAREQMIVDFGNAYFIDKHIGRHGLWPVIEAAGHGNPDTLKALLLYYILESRSNAHALDWYEGSYARILFPGAHMESQRLSDMLASVGREDCCRRFFSAYISWLKDEPADSGKGAILIDSTGLPDDMRLPVTAVSNHNGDVSREARLIYAVQRGTGMPICMRCVPGNIVDVSTLLATIAELKAMKVDTKFAILDAGCLTLDSMEILLGQKISFLSRVKRNWKIIADAVAEHLPGLECEENLLLHHGRIVYIKRMEKKMPSGRAIYCYLGLDDDRRDCGKRQLAKSAEEDQLSRREISERISKMGVFMLVSSRRIAVKDLLPLYYTRQDMEQVFDITKGYAKALPLCVQTVDTFRGHLLMVFMSTVVLRMLQQELKDSKFSLDDVMMAMRNQKAKVFENEVIPSEASRRQREIYKAAWIKEAVSIPRRPPAPKVPDE